MSPSLTDITVIYWLSGSLGVAEWINVLVLTAAEDCGAVEHGEDHRGQTAGNDGGQQVEVDEMSRQHCRLGQRAVELGEVEEEPEEDERYAEDKYSKYQVERQEPLASLPQQVALLRGPLGVAHLVTHVAQRLQLGSLAAVKSNRGGQRTNPVDETAGQVQSQELEGDGVEGDEEQDGDEDVLPEEDGEESQSHRPVEDGEGVEGDADDHPDEGQPSLLALIEVEDGLQEREEGDGETEELYEAPVPLQRSLHLLELLLLLAVGRRGDGEVADELGEAVDDDAVTQHHQVQYQLAGGSNETLQTAEVHGLPLAGRVAAAQRHHDHREQRVDQEVDPVRPIAATATFVETALVDLGQYGHQDWRDDQDQCQTSPCSNTILLDRRTDGGSLLYFTSRHSLSPFRTY